MRVTIPDALADQLAALHVAPNRPFALDAFVIKLLERFKILHVDERIVLLRQADLAEVEAALDASIASVADLVVAIRRLRAVRVGGPDGVVVPFTPAQQRQIALLAAKNRVTPEAQTTTIAAEAIEYILGAV